MRALVFSGLTALASTSGCGVTAPPSATLTMLVPTPDGEELYVEIRGEGEPALVVPARLFLADDLAPLADDHRVIFYDMRNRGLSSAVQDDSTLTIQQDVADLETVRQALGLETFDLVGYSYLGLMTAMYADAHPGRVPRLVQIGPVAITYGTDYRDSFEGEAFAAVAGGDAWAALEKRRAEIGDSDPRKYCLEQQALVRPALFGDPDGYDPSDGRAEQICSMPNEWPVNLERHFASHFMSVREVGLTTEDFADLDIPVLVIHGDRDRNAPYGGGREWAFALPDARLLTVEGAAHGVPAERPYTITFAIKKFLNGAWPDDVERVLESPRAAGD